MSHYDDHRERDDHEGRQQVFVIIVSFVIFVESRRP
jgi:hypothetical protein